MTETYTEEDFETADFARHADGRVAMRAEPDTGIPWYVGDDPFKRLDADMAHEGWVPVVTSAAGNDRRAERLKRQVTEQDITICRRNRGVADLRAQVRELSATPDTPVVAPMSELHELWATAEIPAMRTPICEGDWIIFPHNGEYRVRRVGREDRRVLRAGRRLDPWAPDVRVLERAPAPWQAIADAMPENWAEEAREYAAKMLHEAGAKMGEK